VNEIREVKLDNLTIHFVKDDTRKKNVKNPIISKSKKFDMTGGGRNSRQGDSPFEEMERMERKYDELFKRRQQQMEQMLKNRMSSFPQMPGQSSTPRNMRNKTGNNQLPQDSTALKKQIGEQIEKQQQMKNELQKNIARNKEFQKKNKQLIDKGYKVEKESYDPGANDSGSFKIDYKKENGESASIKGKMNKGKMEDLQSFGSEEKKKLTDELKKDKRFKKFAKDLKRKGYDEEKISFEQEDNNKTVARAQFKNKKDQKSTIKAEFENDKIASVELESDPQAEEKNESNFWKIFFILAALLLAAYLYFRKYGRKNNKIAPIQTPVEEEYGVSNEEPVDLLEKAREYYEQERYKDAYGLVGRAVRTHLGNFKKSKKELTNDEIIGRLRTSRRPYKEIKKCFDMCSLVEFAKYHPNKKDFDTIIEIAKKAISTSPI